MSYKIGIIDAGGAPSIIEVTDLAAAASTASVAMAAGAQAVWRADVDGVGARVKFIMS